jgi:phosphoenolpyruvate synthase/pyruvate phosphate dikinase
MTHVLALAECSPDRAAEVGGKTKGLHALISLGLPVPPGFAITAEAYRDVLRATGVQDAITEIHSGDLVRMDGGTGHIQILDRAPSDDLSSQS